MRVLDLTHTIRPAMPVFPGDPQPALSPASTVAQDGFAATLLALHSHTGTHMDAPAHLFPGKPTLDGLPPERFIGRGFVLDCRNARGEIGLSALHAAGPAAAAAEFLLFYTGWAEKWGFPGYFEGFPRLSPALAEAIAAAGKKGVGLDAASPDAIEYPALPAHRLLLGRGLVIVENLTNLGALLGRPFTFCALPLKYVDADGAPVRAAALLD